MLLQRVSSMSSRVPHLIPGEQIEGRLPRARRHAGLGPVGSSMIDLIGASLMGQSGTLQAQPHAAIWAKL